MQVKKIPIYEFLEGRNKSFVIPVYQRDYAWKINNCKKLWEDILYLQQSGKPSHFLGALVNIYNNQEEWMVIDGQQRLTTISLLLLALGNYLKVKPDKKPSEADLQEDILDYYLINKRCKHKSQRIRLKPNKRDKSYFESLFETSDVQKNDSNIIQNYLFFYDKVSTCQILPSEIFELFKKLEIVNIELEKNIDDPQLIFESLNSTGVDLTDGDLIRNYILMDLDQDKQEHLYNEYWIKIEQLSGNVANFIRAFLMYTLHKDITQSNRAIYNEFKQYSEAKFSRDSYKILKHLLKYAEIYSYFVNHSQHPDKDINQAIHRLYRLEFTVCHPFLLDVFDLFTQNVLNVSDVLNIIQLIESYAFRKILVDYTTQGLNKFFLTLSKEIKKENGWKDNYFQIMAFIIKNKSARQKIPTDDEFRETLIYKEIYKLKAKNRDFLLESLENYNSPYKIDVQELTTEHIMPQKLNQKWKIALGNKFAEIHAKYLHTLGNLSLTAKNRSLSNKDFQTKQKIDFESSKLKLSCELKNIEEWNEEAIIKRASLLAEEAIKIWKYPESNFSKDIEEEKVYYDFHEETDFRGTKPKTLIVGETKYKIKTWRDVLRTICQILFNQSPTEFKFIMNSSELSRYFSEQKDDAKLRCPIEFSDSYFVESNQSSNSIISFCCKICQKLDFDTENISIEIL